MSTYFDELERELRAAVPRVAVARGAARRGNRRRVRASLSGLVPAAGVAVALAVAVLALVLVGRHGRPAAQRAPAVSAIAPGSALTPFLFASSIAAVPFGTRIGPALRSLNTSLGGSEHVVEHTQGCGYDTVVTWPGVEQSSARSRVEFALTVVFRAARLVGYSYGSRGDLVRRAVVVDPRTGRQEARLRLTTSRGLTVGDSLARGRALYGGGFTISGAQGAPGGCASPAAAWRALPPACRATETSVPAAG